jgi:hypothetical protein
VRVVIDDFDPARAVAERHFHQEVAMSVNYGVGSELVRKKHGRF